MNTILLSFKKRRHLPLVIAAIFSLVIATQALAAAGSLDPTFGANGIAIADLGSSSDTGRAIALQADGKIIMMASAQGQRPILMRYNSNGSVDTSYGTGGQVAVESSGCDFAIQSDGKVVVGGSISRGNISLLRYLGTGALDNTFGTNGIATLSLGGDFNTWCNDITIQPDHKIVVFGSEITAQSNHTDFFFARFNEDGSRDAINFIDKGYFTTSQFNYGQAVAIQSDGKIIVSGGMQDYEGNGQISLARLNTDGFLDKTFGTNGKGTVIVAVPNYFSYKSSLALQTDGRIVVAGTANIYYSNPNENLAVARFNSNGALDTTFGGTGIVFTDFGANEFGADVHLQADGKIIVVGTSSASGSSNLLIVRYNKDGSLDSTFGDNGKLIGGLGAGSSSGAKIEVQPNGRIIVTGSSNGDAFLARYNVIDTTSTSTTVVYESVKSFDGSILESGENSNTGGILDRNAVTFNVGDDQKDRQYRGILSFNTSSIPDNALITSAQVKIKKQAVIGTDPALTFGDLLLDMRNGSFSNNVNLQASDFAAAASPGSISERFSNLTYDWYAVNLSNTNLGFINILGVTQFRVRFSLDDNDDMGMDYIKFFSGNSVEANRPQLVITYNIGTGSTAGLMMQSSLPLTGGDNQPPTITSANGFSIPEHTIPITTVTASDADLPSQPLAFSIVGGPDSSLFKIDPVIGLVYFITAPDFHSPTDADLNNIYNVTVQVSDGTLTASQDITFTVTGTNQYAPVITSANGFIVPENTSPITTVTASDADLPAQPLTFSIVGGSDSSRFNINPAIGLVDFIIAPDFEAPTDSDLNNIYNVTVQVSDGTLTASQDISFTVTAMNENTPMITSGNGFAVPENTLAVATVTASDADLPIQTLTFSIAGGPDAACFNIDSSTGELVFVTPPDFEIPTDAGLDNIYNVTVQASDGELAITQDLAVTVTPVNDNSPVMTSVSALGTVFNIPENTSFVTTITATDADLPLQALTFSIIGGADSTLFNINPLSGELVFIASPNFEAPSDAGMDNNYNVTVQTSDGILAVTQDLIITVNAVNDNTPVITSTNMINVPENIPAVSSITATDADLPAESLIYSIAGGLDSTRFNINPATGELTFIVPPDFENPTDVGLNNIYNLNVQVSDGVFSVTQDLVVIVSAINDNAPVITSVNAYALPESTSLVAVIAATDVDLPAQSLAFSIAGGFDAARFSIDSSTGLLTFIVPPDFEVPTDMGLDNTYNVIVQASDGAFSTTKDLLITVTMQTTILQSSVY